MRGLACSHSPDLAINKDDDCFLSVRGPGELGLAVDVVALNP